MAELEAATSSLHLPARKESPEKTSRCSAQGQTGLTATVRPQELLLMGPLFNAQKPAGSMRQITWRASIPIRCLKLWAMPSSPGPRAIISEFIIQHQHRITDAQRCVHDLSIGHVSDVQDLGIKRVLVELKGLLCLAHDQVWSEGMKSWGNSFDLLGHRNLLRRGILD